MIEKHLQPHLSDDTQITIDDAPERDLSVEQTNRALAMLGCHRIPADKFIGLRNLGIQAKHAGILAMIHGSTVLTQQEVIASMQKVSETMEGANVTSKEVREGAKVIGYLAGQIAKVNSSAVKSEAVVVQAAAEVDKRRRASFAPGQVITVNPKPA
jgi:hypothetical protein